MILHLVGYNAVADNAGLLSSFV